MFNIRKKTARVLMVVCAAFALSAAAPAYAQQAQLDPSIDVAGTDQSANLGALNNVGKTVISFLINVVARVIGVGLAVFAIMQFVKREVVWGVVSFVLCGVCFFLPQIILGISRMGGGAA